MGSQPLRVTRVKVPAGAGAAFEDVDLADLLPHRSAVRVTVKRYEPTFQMDFHPSPNRMLVFTLRGQAEVRLSDSDARVFGPGDVLFYEDTHGRGHSTRVIGGTERVTVTVDLAD